MKTTWNMIFYGFVLSIFTVEIYFLGCGAETSPPLSSEGESDFNKKLYLLSSKFVPTAFLPLEEFYTFSDNSSLRKIDRQCIEDSRRYVKALWNQSEWALSSILKFIKILVHVIRRMIHICLNWGFK